MREKRAAEAQEIQKDKEMPLPQEIPSPPRAQGLKKIAWLAGSFRSSFPWGLGDISIADNRGKVYTFFQKK